MRSFLKVVLISILLIFAISLPDLLIIPKAQSTYITFTIQNSQPVATPSPFQQLVNISVSEIGYFLFSQIEQNPLDVLFYEPGVGNLYAWLENITPTYMLWFVKLPYGIPAGSSVTVYMYLTTQNQYPYTGIDPALDQYYKLSYGEYDNGFDVFLYYCNFVNGNGWYETSYFTGNINDGAYMSSSLNNAGIYTELPFQVTNEMSIDIISNYPVTLALSEEPPSGGHTVFRGPPPHIIQNGYAMLFGYYIPFAIIVNGNASTPALFHNFYPNWVSTYTFQWYNNNLTMLYNFQYMIGIVNNTFSSFPYIGLFIANVQTSLVYTIDIRYAPPNSIMPSVIVQGVEGTSIPISTIYITSTTTSTMYTTSTIYTTSTFTETSQVISTSIIYTTMTNYVTIVYKNNAIPTIVLVLVLLVIIADILLIILRR